MSVAVARVTIIRRRRLFIISAASHPRNWYVTAEIIKTNPASSGKVASIAGPKTIAEAMHKPIIPGSKMINVRLTNELR